MEEVCSGQLSPLPFPSGQLQPASGLHNLPWEGQIPVTCLSLSPLVSGTWIKLLPDILQYVVALDPKSCRGGWRVRGAFSLLPPYREGRH